MASFKLHVEDRFAAATSNPKGWRQLARAAPRRGDYDRLILTGAAAFFVGAAGFIGLQFFWFH
jgi:hypothetical protein